jgi:LPS export ABC transporter protein LptC
MITGLARYTSFAAALMLSCFFILSCENDMEAVDELMKKKVAVEEATNVTSYMSQEGKMKAKLTAPYMLIHQPPSGSESDTGYVEFPKTLHVDFYNDSANTTIESTLDALYAKYRETEKKVYLRDSVVVINILKKDTLRTDELWWDQNKEEFYTDKPVRIHQPDKTIYGTGLRAAQDFTWYEIFKIKGTVLTKGDELE